MVHQSWQAIEYRRRLLSKTPTFTSQSLTLSADARPAIFSLGNATRLTQLGFTIVGLGQRDGIARA
jgi:hypothetical protein